MKEILHESLHVIGHSLSETVNLLPFLYLTYLLMEFLEHKSGDATEKLLRRSGKIGPLLGGALGIVPQCGFSAAASGLYAGRLITVGTLLAVYLSTSDEMLPVMISGGVSPLFMLAVLGCKLIIAVTVGFAADALFRLFSKNDSTDENQIEDLCERDHCKCGEHFALSALNHTLRTLAFIFLISLLLNA
ncbi:MAG: arsenic efflux protein, partial [Clostridia bacterium]|nr:arsenic efflux protein [Clostridia bacterium]